MRRRRRDAGLVRLGDRDLFALRVVGEQYVVRLSLLVDILTVVDGAPVSADAARKIAGRWHRARLAEVAPILAGQGSHAWLTPYGIEHYPRIEDAERQLLPLQPIYFLASSD